MFIRVSSFDITSMNVFAFLVYERASLVGRLSSFWFYVYSRISNPVLDSFRIWFERLAVHVGHLIDISTVFIVKCLQLNRFIF